MNSAVHAPAQLAPDPLLARRDDLLDDTVAGAALMRLMEDAGHPRPHNCSRIRARYRRGESLRATYELRDEGGSRLVSARMFAAHKAAAKFAQARDAAAERGAPRGSVLFDEALATVFWLFPEDRKLRGLEQLTSPPPSARSAFGEPWSGSELVAYTPEKAATARCLGAAGDTIGFAKVQLGEEPQRSVAVLSAVRRGLPLDGRLWLPQAVALLPDHHMGLYSPAPGAPLHQLPRESVPDAMARLGEALSVLHGQSTQGFSPFTRLDPSRIRAAGELVRSARPELAPLVGNLVEVLLAEPPAPAAPVLLHGDLHPKNVLVHEAGISLVDLDQAAAGPAAAELGATLARLWCPRPGDELSGTAAATAGDALLAGYGRSPARADLVWYAAAALLVERSARAVNRVDLATLAELEQVLTTALQWAAHRTETRP